MRSAEPTIAGDAVGRTTAPGAVRCTPCAIAASARRGVLQEPASEHDVEHLLLETQTLGRHAHERHDLVDQPRDDRGRDRIVGCNLHHEWRKLHQPALAIWPK